jgi:hypothetical protein
MIQSKGLSRNYWAEAINCANYIVNHTTTKALKNITPEEAWTKIKQDVSHFHVFGSIAWAHIPDGKRKALQPKSEKCIFVGYSEYVKGYRLIQPHCNEIIIRRDFKFDENILSCEPNSTIVPSSPCEPSSTFVLSYGLKQAPRAWYDKMDRFLIKIGFSRCHFDPDVLYQESRKPSHNPCPLC